LLNISSPRIFFSSTNQWFEILFLLIFNKIKQVTIFFYGNSLEIPVYSQFGNLFAIHNLRVVVEQTSPELSESSAPWVVNLLYLKIPSMDFRRPILGTGLV